MLYTSDQAGSRDTAGGAVRFVTPTIANGMVYLGAQFEVDAYGLLPKAGSASHSVGTPAATGLTPKRGVLAAGAHDRQSFETSGGGPLPSAGPVVDRSRCQFCLPGAVKGRSRPEDRSPVPPDPGPGPEPGRTRPAVARRQPLHAEPPCPGIWGKSRAGSGLGELNRVRRQESATSPPLPPWIPVATDKGTRPAVALRPTRPADRMVARRSQRRVPTGSRLRTVISRVPSSWL